jgi:hypothetical protein
LQPLAEENTMPLRFEAETGIWDHETRSVAIRARETLGDLHVLCRVSQEALEQLNHGFCRDSNEALEIFSANRVLLEQRSSDKFDRGAIEPNGSVIVRSDDVPRAP